jgi:FlaA1/EpsC-like NDP-sugar epimerase
VEFTGLRPGEKLHEQLFYQHETVQPTGVEKVLRASAGPPPPDIRIRALELLHGALGESDERLRENAFHLVSYITRGDDAIGDQPASVGVPVMHARMPAVEVATN